MLRFKRGGATIIGVLYLFLATILVTDGTDGVSQLTKCPISFVFA